MENNDKGEGQEKRMRVTKKRAMGPMQTQATSENIILVKSGATKRQPVQVTPNEATNYKDITAKLQRERECV